MAKYRHIVTSDEVGMTINRILKRNFDFSARFRTKIKYQELIDLDGVKTPGYVMPDPGSIIEVRLPEESSSFPAEDIPVNVIHEDDDLLIIDKQPGLTVHPTKGHPDHTLANGIMKYQQDTDQSFKIRFANRIDTDTSGLIIVAKNSNAQNVIATQMKKGSVKKIYIALVHGNFDTEHFTIDLPIGRPFDDQVQRAVMMTGGKDAVTEVTIIEQYDGYSLAELSIHTGRTHQIRVHMSHIGHPVSGDSLYGGASPGIIDRQALHARMIELRHPASGEIMIFTAPVPDDISDAISKVRIR